MIGLSRLITAWALLPRRDRSSVRSLSRIRLLGRLARLDQRLGAVPADVESQEVEALVEGDDARLVLVERQAPGRQPVGEPGLDLERLLPGVAEGDEIIGVSDQDRAARRDPPGVLAGGVAGSGGRLHPVQGDVQQHRADHTALRSSLLGAVQPTLLDHARLQPLRDHSPGGERAEHGQNVVVGDAVERPGQVCVQRPQASRASALDDLVDGLDRVMAAAAGPKPVGPRLEPRLPLGLQRSRRPVPGGTYRRSRESLAVGAWCDCVPWGCTRA